MNKYSVLGVLLFAGIIGFSGVTQAGLNNGLVAYYPFNGNANDESGNGNNGVINGAALTEDRFGNTNSAYSFDGNDYIEVSGQSYIDLVGDLTISAWILAQGGSAEGRGLIVAKGDGDDLVNAYQLRFQHSPGDQALLFAVSDGGSSGSYLLNSNGSVPFGVYTHVAATIQGTEAKTYVNGYLVDSGSITSNRYTDQGMLVIGGRVDGWAFFEGYIDEVRIYNRALSESEINDLYTEDSVCESNGYTNADLDIARTEGRQACIADPASCGIEIGSGYDVGYEAGWVACLADTSCAGGSEGVHASFTPSAGTLSIPFVDVPDYFGGITTYSVDMTIIPEVAPLSFSLSGAAPVE